MQEKLEKTLITKWSRKANNSALNDGALSSKIMSKIIMFGKKKMNGPPDKKLVLISNICTYPHFFSFLLRCFNIKYLH